MRLDIRYLNVQGVTINGSNETIVIDNMADNPDLWMYNLVYGMSLIAIVAFFALRSVVIVKVKLPNNSIQSYTHFLLNYVSSAVEKYLPIAQNSVGYKQWLDHNID